TTGATAAATVSGNLNLNGSRNFTAHDSYVLNAADDLVVSALISNGTLNTNAFGTAVLTNAGNTYGATNVNSATLDFNANYNHGLGYPVGGTLVVRGAGVLGTGNVTVNAGGTLVLDNSAGNANRIPDAATLTVAGGNVVLIGNSAGSNE